MNKRMIVQVLGRVLLIEAALLLFPMVVGLFYGESPLPFIWTVLLCAAAGGALCLLKPVTRAFYAREGLAIVALAWILMSLFGALPFVFSGDIPNYVDALFETVSGFTTTGATILTDVEAMGRGCMLWRCFSHWLGGMGVLVFIMAVLPMSGEYSMHIMRAEMPGPVVGKLVPRARKTAVILYIIYIGFTALEFILLLCGGMTVYDAAIHAFATAGTGGFSSRGESIAAYNSAYIEIVVAVFMVLFSINFNLYFYLLIGRIGAALRNSELWIFLGIVLFSSLTIALNITGLYSCFGEALRYSFFQVGAVVSTTGFSTANFDVWPVYSKTLLVLIMFCGACAGSTGGGIKLSRFMILFKSAAAELNRLIRPRSVRAVRLDGHPVDEKTVRCTLVFFALYMLILFANTLLVSFDGFDIVTNFTGTVACLSNIGPGLSLVGPAGNFAMFSAYSKLLFTFCMLLGRLEIFPIMILFLPGTWKKN